MRQVLRLFVVTTAILAMAFISVISMYKMFQRKTTSAVVTELKFAGAYETLPLFTASVSQVFERANPAVRVERDL